MDSASDSGSEGWGFESLLACQPVLMKKMQEKKPHFCVAFSHISQQIRLKSRGRVKFSRNRERDSKITFPEMQKRLSGNLGDSNSFTLIKKNKQPSDAVCDPPGIGRPQAAFLHSWGCSDWYLCLRCMGFLGGLGYS